MLLLECITFDKKLTACLAGYMMSLQCQIHNELIADFTTFYSCLQLKRNLIFIVYNYYVKSKMLS